jgi:hypothetical protein
MVDLIAVITVGISALGVLLAGVYKIIIGSKCKLISCCCCRIERAVEQEIKYVDERNQSATATATNEQSEQKK